MDAVRIQKDAQARSVYDARLKKEPRTFTSSRAACLKGQRNQVLVPARQRHNDRLRSVFSHWRLVILLKTAIRSFGSVC